VPTKAEQHGGHLDGRRRPLPGLDESAEHLDPDPTLLHPADFFCLWCSMLAGKPRP
jgi:hypothetical protein